jgi:hypothetical protein
MAAIVLEGAERIPVRYEDWGEWRTELAVTAKRLPLIAPGTCFCAMCWGAGRVLRQAANGEGLVPLRCATCAGSGVIPLRT